MTAPQQPDSATPALVLEHAAELLLAEEAAAHLATAALRLRLAAIARLFQRRWTDIAPNGRASGVDVIRLMADLARELLALPPIPADQLRAAVEAAYRTGARQAYREAGLPPQPVALPVDDGIGESLARAVVEALDAADRAAQLAQATSRGTPATIGRIVAVAGQGANAVERTVRTLVNERANQAVIAAAEQVGAKALWINELGACVTCLSLAGHVVEPGDLFDSASTFGIKPLIWTPDGGLTAPPRHPSCRCRVTLWFGDMAGKTALPEILQREAERAVLNGWALSSESNSVRAQAAARLLDRIKTRHGTAPSSWKVPPSVEKSTATRLRKGTFGVTPFPGK